MGLTSWAAVHWPIGIALTLVEEREGLLELRDLLCVYKLFSQLPVLFLFAGGKHAPSVCTRKGRMSTLSFMIGDLHKRKVTHQLVSHSVTVIVVLVSLSCIVCWSLWKVQEYFDVGEEALEVTGLEATKVTASCLLTREVDAIHFKVVLLILAVSFVFIFLITCAYQFAIAIYLTPRFPSVFSLGVFSILTKAFVR